MDYEILQTTVFAQWHTRLRDLRVRIAIARRIERASAGNLGDVKNLGGGLSEMRVNRGAGYRIYFTVRGNTLIVLLLGGDKSTQPADICQARSLAKEF
ncbi:type II toxin-antitoxin system RelE/ParE family toxin [Pseudomonas chlororaphis]|uniref:type II toxin-antitoxin system RelE/ParE family toxin n=1 Tax=Pseudomonas chlororaphis TaxID=587753 RepID=UPI000F576A03|nr:type II toxin-antitoxin system RelE/ParE family toxin [Pseudomonas chlororaphis]AZC56425.1 putative toxin [Pseudomonas chlororaphis subsp. piscium]